MYLEFTYNPERRKQRMKESLQDPLLGCNGFSHQCPDYDDYIFLSKSCWVMHIDEERHARDGVAPALF